jgi:hypothetical protein
MLTIKYKGKSMPCSARQKNMCVVGQSCRGYRLVEISRQNAGKIDQSEAEEMH